MGATNRAGLAFNGRRFGGSLECANTHSASGLDGCCGGHRGVHGLNYSLRVMSNYAIAAGFTSAHCKIVLIRHLKQESFFRTDFHAQLLFVMHQFFLGMNFLKLVCKQLNQIVKGIKNPC